MSKSREELLRDLIKKLLFVTKHIGPPHKPGADLHHKFDLSRPQARLFLAIADRKEGVSVKELAEEFGITSGAVSQFVDVLVIKCLVRREEDHHDRRIVRLKVPDDVKKHHDRFKNEYISDIAKRFEVLSDSELVALISLLNKVNSSLIEAENGKDKYKHAV